ncbi:MAG: 2Fe-2S iron-sulfur cluster-binding protein, partial [bacterium]
MSARRLPSGGRIDRDATYHFTWNGKALRGCKGDTLASALMANGVRVVGRSFKYHRPRGIMSAGVEESGALVTIGAGDRRDPNVKATAQALHHGLIASSQNAWPSARFDFGAASDLCGRFLSAGFYYKTFMGPRALGGTALWMQFEKLIRRAAGLGAASRLPDPDQYEHAHDFCDLLVVGAGPAGLSAAATAARAGLDVLLVEQDFELGGDLLHQPPAQSDATLAALRAEVEAAGVRAMTRTTAFGLYDGGVAGLLEHVADHIPRDDSDDADAIAPTHRFVPRQRFWTVRAQRTIIAAGAIERPFAFGDNDRPGVMSASAGRAYLHRFGILPGARIVVATNNDSAYPNARELDGGGARGRLFDAGEGAEAEPR